MSKELLLMQKVDGLGDEGDVVKVADGYARNYLLPRKIASLVSAGTEKQRAKLHALRDVRVAGENEEFRVLSEKIATAPVTIGVKVGEEGKLYGSVTDSDIADALAAKGIEIDRHKIDLSNPLKEIGDHEVSIKLSHDIEAVVKVSVVAEE